MEAYNDYLYRQRKKAGFRRKEVCERIGVSKFLYHRFERGYSVPKGETIDRIDALYGGDFRQYLKGEPSYPEEIRSKEERSAKKRLSKLFSHLWVRILAIVLPFICLLSIPAALIVDYNNTPIEHSYYSQAYELIQKYSVENGQPYVDPLGNFNKKIHSLVHDESGSSMYTAVMAPINANNIYDMQFLCILRDDTPDGSSSLGNFRLSMLYDKGNRFKMTLVDNKTGEYSIQIGRRLSEEGYVVDSKIDYIIDKDNANPLFAYEPTVGFFVSDFAFTLFLNDYAKRQSFGENGLGISDIYDEVWSIKAKGDAKYEAGKTAYTYLSYVGAPIGILLTVLSILSFTFLRAKGIEEPPVKRGELALPDNKRLPLIMGASAIRIMGSILLLLGSTYVLLSIANNFGLISMVISFMDENSFLYLAKNAFYLGVFFLYILGLSDDFGHPKRLYLRTIVIGGVALGVSVLQSLFNKQMSFYENGFVSSVLSYMPSNIFIPIFLFHLTALFLFSKPSFVKVRHIRVWRFMSLLPVLISLSVFLIDLLSNLGVITDVGSLSYFLGNNRFGFTLATYCYLFGNYFIRRSCKKKYGSAYLRGDVYAFYKNLALCVPALLFGIIDLIFFFIPEMRAAGFGDCYSLILVAFIMFLYRGYNDKNHIPALIVAGLIYAIGLVLAYFATVAVVLFYLSLR
ncbi:MAG: helix-turn-helix domain-containing protein [Bacilli bacterium]|nr:helix-turn-helix domain-containing protein [Bacilli bacterium]